MLAKRRVNTVKFTHKSSRKYRLRYSDRKGFPGGSVVKSPPANAGDTDSVPGSGRSPGGGNGNMLQCSCLRIPWTEEPGRQQSMGSPRVGHN